MKKLIWIILLLGSSLHADLKSTTGQIKYDVNSDGYHNLILNDTGLGVGNSPSSQLHVQGNAIISNQLHLGSYDGSSDFNVNGTISYNFQNVSSNARLSVNSSIFADASSGNVTIFLPYAGNVKWRQYQIKKISGENTVWVSGGGNLIDDASPIELPESSSLSSVKLISDGQQWYKIGQKNIFETVASGNLVGWWKLDETSGSTASDSSEEDNDGNSVGVTTGEEGIHKLAYDFPVGNGTYISASIGGISRDYFSIAAWVNLDTLTGTEVIFQYENGTGVGRSLLFHNSGVLRSNIAGSQLNTNQTLNSGEWTHVALTYENSDLKIYINGNEEASGTRVEEDATGNFRIGDGKSGTQGIDGRVDDVRFYDKALTSAEVLAIAQGNL